MTPAPLLLALQLADALDDRPPVADLQWLPTRRECDDAMSFGQRYREHLLCEQWYRPWEYDLQAAHAESCWLRECWQALKEARAAEMDANWHEVREQLQCLRDLMGASYGRTALPVAPLWRFRRRP